MGCLGVHFAITDVQARQLLAAENEDSDDEVMSIVEEIEEAWDEDFLQESDKAWDAIHRCLSDGTLELTAGSYPLKMCIFGGKQLCFSGSYYAVYSTPEEVNDVAEALPKVTKEWMKERYWKMASNYQEEQSEDDFEYTWQNFEGLQQFFRKAAAANRAVIFTVDQ